MSNSTTGKIWKLDTAGLIKSHHDGPVVIKHILFHSNNDGDQFKLRYYNVEAEIAAGCDESYSESHTGKIEGNDTMTMDGGSLLPSTITDGSVFEILRSTGDADNINVPTLVKTAGTNTVVVVWDDPWDNDTTGKDYAWKTYTSYDFFMAFGANDTTYFYNLHDYKLPNLLLETISSGSYVYVYV